MDDRNGGVVPLLEQAFGWLQATIILRHLVERKHHDSVDKWLKVFVLRAAGFSACPSFCTLLTHGNHWKNFKSCQY
jgi:hypothetical protein